MEVTASDYFSWTKYNGIPAALIAVSSYDNIKKLFCYCCDRLAYDILMAVVLLE